MSCRCLTEQWMRDRERQRALAKKAALLTGQVQVLYRDGGGRWCFVPDGQEYKGDNIEIILPY